jgi:hypothetical protein
MSDFGYPDLRLHSTTFIGGRTLSTFNLTEEVGVLEYNFMPYAGSGIIPEPSAIQIQAFRQALGEMLGDVEDSPDKPAQDDPTLFAKRLSEYLNQDTTETDEKSLHLVADVCSNQPSFDELHALPYRARQAFLGWVVGMLLVPEGVRLATSS